MMGDKAGEVKQGAYGKVPTHPSSKLDQLMRPLEVAAALRFKLGGLLEDNLKPARGDADIAFCDDMLGKVSRSFAAVIKQLPPGLALDICVFYLVLRALDTVEDDMEAYKGKEHEKEAELRAFGEKRLSDDKCSIHGVGAGDEATLIQNFGAVSRVVKKLPEGSRVVIRDITDLMGAGMAEYVAADLGQGTVDQAAYDRYCHMVAGLVGEGLTRIFVARGMETDVIMQQGERVWPFCADPQKTPLNMGLANSMGLFLQKANIIRDYLEDYVDGRAFWPQSVWKTHATTGDLGEFARPSAHGAGLKLKLDGAGGDIVAKGVGQQGLMCLNELVADALELVPDSLEYLSRLRDPAVYRFCAIPQVMAMATLAECFDNPRLFTGVVKIRKGLTARLIIATIDGPDAVLWWFRKMARELADSVRNGICTGADGPLGARLSAACARIEKSTAAGADAREAQLSRNRGLVGGAVAAVAAAAAFAISGRA
jgi:farnesyl-diphosphate farnesyltransferase